MWRLAGWPRHVTAEDAPLGTGICSPATVHVTAALPSRGCQRCGVTGARPSRSCQRQARDLRAVVGVKHATFTRLLASRARPPRGCPLFGR